MKILYIPLEFKTWHDASHFPYSGNYGFEEGFKAHGIEYFTIPAIFELDSTKSSPWLRHAKQLCEGKQFDQVWLEIVHTRYDDDVLEWLSLLCEVRVGFMWESMEMHPNEQINNPDGVARRNLNIARSLSIVTHVVFIDEMDVEPINASGKLQAKWMWDAGIQPRSCINLNTLPSPVYPALFYGAMYGIRKQWVESDLLKDILIRPNFSPEYYTNYPSRFNELNDLTLQSLFTKKPPNLSLFSDYMSRLRKIRRHCFMLWLDGLKQGSAVVNLPQFGKGYASRVLEGMAAGRPVISWEIPGRPKTKALFENDREILLFDQNSPEQLADHIHHILIEPKFGEQIAEYARKKLLAHHTTEELVRQIMEWTGWGKFRSMQNISEIKVGSPNASLVFDIGANRGAKSEELLNRGFHVVCVEPQPEMLKILHKKFDGNSNVLIVGKALAEKPGIRTMSICKDAPTISTLSDEWKHGRFADYIWDEQIDVSVTTLDQLISDHGIPAYCKIDVEGYELEVLKGLSQLLPLISFEFTREFIDRARSCTAYLSALGYQEFNFKLAESKNYSSDTWLISDELFKQLHEVQDPLLWGDIYCRFQNDSLISTKSVYSDMNNASQLAPLRLHLGCGEQYLDSYINIDYPCSEHAVMDIKADRYANIATLKYPDNSVDEIRLHHVFEHFNRVTALALLIRWYEWLKPGGKLVIETPDLEGSAKILLSDLPWRAKIATVRHIAGDQVDTWAYHVDHWFPERFQRTLSCLGFTDIKITQSNWSHEPYLANVSVVATKRSALTMDELLIAADSLLFESTVSLSETTTFSAWQKQLRDFLFGGQPAQIYLTSAETSIVPKISSHLPLDEIQNFNQRRRDQWVAEKAVTVPAGAHILDIGAGTCPYRSMFSHCEYKAHDFKKYNGEKLGGTTEYGNIDYVSEITSIPVEDASFDLILCTEVLEHIPEPGLALQEMIRILRPGGRILLTAPLGSGLHQLPYHYYGGFSPEWYRYWAAKTGLSVVEIAPNGGFFRLLSQECVRAAGLISSCPSVAINDINEMKHLLSDKLPRFFFAVEDALFIDQFTVGYHVELHKPSSLTSSTIANVDFASNYNFKNKLDLPNDHFNDLIQRAKASYQQ